MSAPFIPTPDNCTINGGKFTGYLSWDQLDWSGARWREKSSLMVVVCGPDDAPSDPHWSVPHKDGDTWHRVRLKRKRNSRKATP